MISLQGGLWEDSRRWSGAYQNGIGWAGDRNVAEDNNWYSSNILITYHTVIDQEALDAKRQAAIAKGKKEVTLEYGNAALMDWYNDNPDAVVS